MKRILLTQPEDTITADQALDGRRILAVHKRDRSLSLIVKEKNGGFFINPKPGPQFIVRESILELMTAESENYEFFYI